MSEAPKRIWLDLKSDSEVWTWNGNDAFPNDEQYHHASTLRTVLDMLNCNASSDNIRRVIEAELGGE